MVERSPIKSCSSSLNWRHISMGNNWPQEKVEKLIELFGSNLSCGKIAVQLDTTRNAIIGKLSRLGLSNPKPTITFRAPPKPVETPKRRARIRISEIMPDIRKVEINSRGLSLLDLGPDDCRWPFGDHDFTFCGHPRVKS